MIISRRSKCAGKGSRPGWRARGGLARGSGRAFSAVRPLGLLLDFGRRDTGLLEEQRRLRRGELFALGTPELEIEQADFLLLNFE